MGKRRVNTKLLCSAWLLSAAGIALPFKCLAQDSVTSSSADFPDLLGGIAVPASIAQDEDSVSEFSEADQPAEPESFDIKLPEHALKDARCPNAFDGVQAVSMVRMDGLPASTQASKPLANAVCFGSGWSINTGDGVSQPNLSFAFTPDQSLCADGSCEGRQFKSRVQVGIDAVTEGGAAGRGWFLFAGADDKAVMWKPSSSRTGVEDPRLLLNDSVTVGDVEAGVSLVRERTELSVSYIHRETSYRINQEEKLSDTEGYVGVILRLK